MNSTSMDEDELVSPTISDENNKDYMEPCDTEVNDIVPRFQRLNIDDEPKNLGPGITNMPCISTEKNSSFGFYFNFEDQSMPDSNVKVSSEIISGGQSEVTKATTDKEQYLSVAEKMTTDILYPLFKKGKKMKESEEMKLSEEGNDLDKSPLDLCLKHKWDHDYAAGPSPTAFQNKNELTVLKKTQKVDLKTDEILDTSSNILQEKRCNEGENEVASNQIVDLESPHKSYSADVSSDDQSNMKCNVKIASSNTLDSSIKNKALVETKRKRKTPTSVPSVLQMNQIRPRRSSIFPSPSSNIAESEIPRNISTSDEDSKNTEATGKTTHVNSRKRRQKSDKSFSERQSLILSDVKTEEKNRTSVNKRKMSPAKLVQIEKFCKRSTSEKNSGSSRKICLATRSRSKSNLP